MRNGYTTGVAVFTYNGEKFIKEQLDSIRLQAEEIDMVIIYDDRSTDLTYQMVQRYIKDHHLLTWKAVQNIENLGWRKNAALALGACDTDIIFWSDQDDIWDSEKAECLASALLKDDRILAAYSGWKYIDSEGNELKLFSGNGSGREILVNDIRIKKQTPPMLGCSACFRRAALSHLNAVLPCIFDSPDWILLRLCYGLGFVIFVDTPLFSRRIHDRNVTAPLTSAKRRWTFSYKKCVEHIFVMRAQLETLRKINEYIFSITGKYNVQLINEQNDLKARIGFLDGNEDLIPYIFRSYGENSFSDFCYTLFHDIFYKIHHTIFLSANSTEK